VTDYTVYLKLLLVNTVSCYVCL